MNSSCKAHTFFKKALACLFLVSSLCICPAVFAEVVDRIVAVVNDEIITLSELNAILDPFAERIKTMEYSPDRERKEIFETRRQIIDRLIEDKLKDQEIGKYEIVVEDKEIDLAIEDIKKTHNYTDENLRAALAGEHMSMEDYRKRIREQILRARLVNYKIKSKIVITGEDITAYYEAHGAEYGARRRYRLRNIIMTASGTGAGEDGNGTLEEMKRIHERLVQGEDFALLAREHSQSPLASLGGALGEFDLEDLSPEIRSAVEGLKNGEFTSVLNTEQGFQIFQVEKIETLPGKTFAEVRGEIEEKLYQDIVNRKFQDWLTELKQQAHIKIVN